MIGTGFPCKFRHIMRQSWAGMTSLYYETELGCHDLFILRD